MVWLSWYPFVLLISPICLLEPTAFPHELGCTSNFWSGKQTLFPRQERPLESPNFRPKNAECCSEGTDFRASKQPCLGKTDDGRNGDLNVQDLGIWSRTIEAFERKNNLSTNQSPRETLFIDSIHIYSHMIWSTLNFLHRPTSSKRVVSFTLGTSYVWDEDIEPAFCPNCPIAAIIHP